MKFGFIEDLFANVSNQMMRDRSKRSYISMNPEESYESKFNIEEHFERSLKLNERIRIKQ